MPYHLATGQFSSIPTGRKIPRRLVKSNLLDYPKSHAFKAASEGMFGIAAGRRSAALPPEGS